MNSKAILQWKLDLVRKYRLSLAVLLALLVGALIALALKAAAAQSPDPEPPPLTVVEAVRQGNGQGVVFMHDSQTGQYAVTVDAPWAEGRIRFDPHKLQEMRSWLGMAAHCTWWQKPSE